MLSLPHVDLELEYGYITWKANTRNSGLNLKNTLCALCIWGWGFHANPTFVFNIFSSDLHFDVLIIGFCWIFLIIGQTLGTISKVFVGVLTKTWQVSLAWVQVNNLAKRFALGHLGQETMNNACSWFLYL